jgi:hypothetical protein
LGQWQYQDNVEDAEDTEYDDSIKMRRIKMWVLKIKCGPRKDGVQT